MTDAEAPQRQVVDFLRDALSDQDGPAKVITTHVSVIVMGGERALKMKRAVQFPFLDFRTLAARHAACEAELGINRRTAPDIYRRIATVTRTDDGRLSLDGDGTPVEYLVDMKRFDDSKLFDRLAGIDGGLKRRMIEALADEVARFHDDAEIKPARGGHAGIRRIAENNRQSFEKLPRETFEQSAVAMFVDGTLERIDGAQAILESRRANGRVRGCHGDLHLRNICLIDGHPTLFDAIEFSADFSEIDVVYDLAFLLMDLDFRGHRRLASVLLNRYLEVGSESTDAFAVLPIFLSMRAQIRAHVGAAIARSQDDKADCEREMETARQYLNLAATYLTPPPPRLIAVGGLSGSGKSRLARELAPFVGAAPGARVVRTDVIRKRLAGVHPNDKLGPDGYTAEMTTKTYAAFAEQTLATLSAGHSVIMDAVFAKPEQRTAAAAIAERASIPFLGIWVDAPEDVRLARVEERKNNVSDANAAVARAQSEYDLGEMAWRQVDSSGTKAATLRRAMALLDD